jgi:hypothetical protein
MFKPITVVAAVATCASLLVFPAGAAGPDVLYSGISDIANHGAVGGIRAYTLGTSTCNIGNQNLLWTNDGTPGVGFNAYRLHGGRMVQIGLSWVKTACCAAAGSGCGLSCNGQGGSVLGAGCLDVYSSGWNAIQSNMAPRAGLNAWSGSVGGVTGTSGDAIFKRLQVAETSMNPATFPGALYFVEGVYVGSDDASNGNRNNNASYRRVTSSGSPNYTFSLVDTTQQGIAAINAWRAHGLGLGMPDTSVVIGTLDVPNEGRFHYAYKPKDNGNGTWRYEYAVFNLSSDRSGGSFVVPIPANTIITNTGFSKPNYHSGEVYSNADWTVAVNSNDVTWATPQTFVQNANSSALRWGTMYNFWFDANRPPENGQVTLGLFKPHSPQTVSFTAAVPGVDCIADVDGDDDVDADDLTSVILDWGSCPKPPAPCPGDVNDSGAVDADDVTAVILGWGPC